MHKLILVTINSLGADTSAAARARVAEWLVDQGFTIQNRFARGWCEWFSLGGTWTGYLTGEVDESRQRFVHGHDDDAQMVTQELYDAHLKTFEGKKEDYDGGFADLNCDQCSAEFVGKKWLVVVDATLVDLRE